MENSNLDENIDDAEQSENFQFSIYEELLKDKVITLSFKEAIEQNSEIFKDKVNLSI